MSDDCWFMACDAEAEGVLVRGSGEHHRVCEECARRAVQIGDWLTFRPDND